MHKQIEELTPVHGEQLRISSDADKHIRQAQQSASQMQKELNHLLEAKCPYCLQKFEDTQAKIDELQVKIKETNEAADHHIDAKQAADALAKELSATMSELRNGLLHTTYKQMLQEKANVDTYRQQLKATEDSTNPHLEAYEQLLNEAEVVVDYSKLDQMKSDLEHQKFLLKLLVDKNSFIRKKIINKSIPFLNKQIHYHAKSLGLTHVVTFNPDMSCDITEFGRPLDYGNLSGGEKKRLNLALSMAFRDMLQHLHTGVNILVVDEVDAGAMDAPGVEGIIRSVKMKSAQEKNLGIWVISHRPECVGRFDREMTVRFENGFSSIGGIEVL